jgi:hypothetical protein
MVMRNLIRAVYRFRDATLVVTQRSTANLTDSFSHPRVLRSLEFSQFGFLWLAKNGL